MNGVWVPREPLLHIWPHLEAASAAGVTLVTKGGLGFVHSQVEVLLQAGGGVGSPQRVQWLPPHPHFFLTSPGLVAQGTQHTVQDLLSHR